MNSTSSDRLFAGSIPQLYERYLVPLIFEPYARDLSRRVVSLKPDVVLEIAAGTGVVTRHLAAQLPASTSIVATDLNQPMLAHAARIGTNRPVTWQQADALRLPFQDNNFDVVVCQFGIMFFPDKIAAFAEALRVLRPGGTFLFNVWDRIELNEFADCVTQALTELFLVDPPSFLSRVPHGYYDSSTIAEALLQSGFERSAAFETVTARSRAESPRIPAIAYCQGTPLRNEIEARNSSALDEATDIATDAITRRFGHGYVDAGIQARVVSIAR